MPTIAWKELRDFACRLFQSVGVPEADAALVADSLVQSNLRGHDSHGVMRVPQYVDFLEKGEYQVGVPLRVEKESAATVLADGQWGLGQLQAHRLLDLVIPKAKELGIAAGVARNCGHIGRLGEYAERSAGEGLVLLATVNNCGAGLRVAPPGGIAPRLGTNPFCAGVPTEADPVVLDFGTSVVAEGKVRVYHISGQPVPEGWLLDSQGKPTTDPSVLYNKPQGSILPVGGPQAYKGFGLALVLDMLAGGLSGGLMAHQGAPAAKGNNLVFLAIAPGHFHGLAELKQEASVLSKFMRDTPKANAFDEILLPGDPERRTLKKRSETGIPLPENHWSRLLELAQRLNVPAPPA